MINKNVVKRKLRYLSERLEELKVYEHLTLVQYGKDITSQRVVERLLQLSVESACDVNDHMIVESGNAPPKNYYESFLMMGQYGFIPKELAKTLAPAAGQRNILVHEYEKLDNTLVYEGMKDALHFFPTYIRKILHFLDQLR